MKLSELVTVPVPPIMDMVRIRSSDGGGGDGDDDACRLMMAGKNIFHGKAPKASLGGTGGGVGGHSKKICLTDWTELVEPYWNPPDVLADAAI